MKLSEFIIKTIDECNTAGLTEFDFEVWIDADGEITPESLHSAKIYFGVKKE